MRFDDKPRPLKIRWGYLQGRESFHTSKYMNIICIFETRPLGELNVFSTLRAICFGWETERVLLYCIQLFDFRSYRGLTN